MFSVDPSRFSGDDPWFRIGSFGVGSTALASMTMVGFMFVWAFEGPSHVISDLLGYSYSGIKGGEVWRLATYVLPSAPSLWIVLSAAFMVFLGSQLELVAGRVRMAYFLVALLLVTALLALLIDVIGLTPPLLYSSSAKVTRGGQLLATGVFYAFIARAPHTRFLFGIPGWVMGVVFFTLELLAAMGDGNLGGVVFVIGRVGLWFLVAKAFGLADDTEWIPDLRPADKRGAGPRFTSPRGDLKSNVRPSRPGRGSKANLSVVPPGDSFDEMGIDAILDQVSEHGVDSLSSAQKKKLKAYSKQQKKKRGDS